MTEREASRHQFEVHMMMKNPCTRLSRFMTSPTDYKTKSVQASWELWQASRQQALEDVEIVAMATIQALGYPKKAERLLSAIRSLTPGDTNAQA